MSVASTRFSADDLLEKLSLGQKIALLTGYGLWHTTPIPDVDIPPIRMSDGPNGVRGTRFFNGIPSNCFPCGTGLGSTFDVGLAEEIGKALGDECHAKGCHILLGPTINTHRSPLGGRGFESFSEDPHLNGHIAAAYVKGLQSKGVSATLKHFVANEQEFQSHSSSSDVSERALREIYLKPFQIAVKYAKPWAVMSAYNRLNGIHCSENEWLLNDVLRKEWGYEGMVMSDWTGTYSTTESIKAGVDLEMPGPTVMRGGAVFRAIQAEKLFPHDIDIRVRKILRMLQHARDSAIPFNAPEEILDTPAVRRLLRKASASAIVLLKNEKGILPIEHSVRKIAVIGPNARQAVISGGGSASLRPTYTVSPLEGITAAAQEIGAQVEYALGTLSVKRLPVMDAFVSYDGSPGGLLEFWNESPTSDWLSTSPDFSNPTQDVAWSTRTESTMCFLVDGVDDNSVNDVCWIRFSTTFTPDEDGDWQLEMSLGGRGNLFIDQKLVLELSVDPPQGESFLGLGTVEVRAVLPGLKAGTEYELEIRISNEEFVARGASPGMRGGFQLGGIHVVDPERALRQAVHLAKTSDIVVLVVGLNNDWETEGADRATMSLPGLTDRLVSEVLDANSQTVVISQSGTPVTMPWIHRAHTVLQAFYGGNEVGNGMADVLFGKVNPSGKLSLTFPKRIEDNPSYTSFGNTAQVHGHVLYNEGIYVGYRGYEVKKLEPLFPFGHGLSYTTFEYSDLEISEISEHGKFSVQFKVKNSGNVEGSEVAQVYIADPEASLPRPVKELKGFAKTVALRPGQSERCTVHLDKYALSFYDERRGAWVAEAGKFEVLVGASSADVKLSGHVKLRKSFHWTGL